ncbi:adenosylcobinamide-GDP ribazoletransferase [Paenibacillus sp. LHD-38]|uniref:adenosylcobinamide-GDP ribazoletransferase n=1 Tax=Paenibacillus sp. LHD-38 TaxID=3072143 RepID=UPI00280EA06D|nr:adenosylcobinamide-GDP ribazoletransferase [Paenibacillus sp. LHD-38]MDQ8735264.1 adenosylcobinamide-GDP ribazoletransferase [Paenibacillus sp. LHD-38]
MVHRELKLQIQALIAALQFLTRFPVPVTVPFQAAVLSRSVVYFPMAGAIIGACIYAITWLLALFVPAWPSAVLVLIFWTALSGGLHLDGWMDTADGVLSHRSRERMLEIMKDSRVGAMGVLAAVFLLLFKASLLAELLQHENFKLYGPLFVIIPMWSRAWMSTAIAGWPFARKGEGIAILFHEVKGAQAAAALLITAVGTALILRLIGISIDEIVLCLLAIVFCVFVVGGMLASWLNHKLGGLTGDTYGAMNEAIEAVLLFAAVVWLHAY